MHGRVERLLEDLDLEPGLAFCRDRLFYLALLAGPASLLLLTWLAPSWRQSTEITLWSVLYMVAWQPLVEELFFRGIVQGWLRTTRWGQLQALGLSMANLVTTAFFTGAHLVHYANAWSAAVLVPSLIFGYFRDKHRKLLPPLILHSSYNASYLFVTNASEEIV